MKRFELTYKFTLVVLVAFLLVVGCDDDRDTYVPVPVITTIQPDSGAVLPGEFVTIFGGNFSPIANENIVTLGGIMATVTEAANNQLTIIVPEGAENGIISVTVNGQTGTARKQLTIIQTPVLPPDPKAYALSQNLKSPLNHRLQWRRPASPEVNYRLPLARRQIHQPCV